MRAAPLQALALGDRSSDASAATPHDGTAPQPPLTPTGAGAVALLSPTHPPTPASRQSSFPGGFATDAPQLSPPSPELHSAASAAPLRLRRAVGCERMGSGFIPSLLGSPPRAGASPHARSDSSISGIRRSDSRSSALSIRAPEILLGTLSAGAGNASCGGAGGSSTGGSGDSYSASGSSSSSSCRAGNEDTAVSAGDAAAAEGRPAHPGVATDVTQQADAASPAVGVVGTGANFDCDTYSGHIDSDLDRGLLHHDPVTGLVLALGGDVTVHEREVHHDHDHDHDDHVHDMDHHHDHDHHPDHGDDDDNEHDHHHGGHRSDSRVAAAYLLSFDHHDAHDVHHHHHHAPLGARGVPGSFPDSAPADLHVGTDGSSAPLLASPGKASSGPLPPWSPGIAVAAAVESAASQDSGLHGWRMSIRDAAAALELAAAAAAAQDSLRGLQPDPCIGEPVSSSSAASAVPTRTMSRRRSMSAPFLAVSHADRASASPPSLGGSPTTSVSTSGGIMPGISIGSSDRLQALSPLREHDHSVPGAHHHGHGHGHEHDVVDQPVAASATASADGTTGEAAATDSAAQHHHHHQQQHRHHQHDTQLRSLFTVHYPTDSDPLHVPAQVVPGLWLGGWAASTDPTFLSSAHIQEIVNCAGKHDVTREMVAAQRGAGVRHIHYLDLEDVEAFDARVSFYIGAQLIAAALDSRHAVLVHCLQGVSRSVSVITAYLVRYRGMSLLEALTTLKAARKFA